MSEISTPDIDWDSRKKIMDMISRREKDLEELDLQNTFSQLLNKAEDVTDKDEVESLASKTAKEFRESGQINIYKPTLKPKKSLGEVSNGNQS